MEAYKSGWQSIVKPSSFNYDEFDLGPNLRSNKFNPKIAINRLEFETLNGKGQSLKCSFFHEELDFDRPLNPLKTREERKDFSNKPCIVYCHSHSANRIEGIPIVHHAIPEFNICVFDFSGCGNSEGEWVTLGLKERDDVKAVLMHLEIGMKIKDFFLWGRSMGAVSCMLMLAEEIENGKPDDGVERMVHAAAYDSPFTDSKEMVK